MAVVNISNEYQKAIANKNNWSFSNLRQIYFLSTECHYLRLCWRPFLARHTVQAQSAACLIEQLHSYGTAAQILPPKRHSAMSITFPAAEWTSRTADNKNSLEDASVIAFAKFFSIFIYLIFPMLLFLMNFDRMTLPHLRAAFKTAHRCSTHRWTPFPGPSCSVFQETKEICHPKKNPFLCVMITWNWDLKFTPPPPEKSW